MYRDSRSVVLVVLVLTTVDTITDIKTGVPGKPVAISLYVFMLIFIPWILLIVLRSRLESLLSPMLHPWQNLETDRKESLRTHQKETRSEHASLCSGLLHHMLNTFEHFYR